jgi:hypothetical protein
VPGYDPVKKEMPNLQLPAPTGVTARFQGSSGGSTTWYYWVQALYPSGYSQLSASANTGAKALAALTNNNINAVSWNPAPGAIAYIVYRSTSSTLPASGATAIFLATSETGFKDDGSLPTFTQVPRYDGLYVWKALYSFAVDGGAVSAITPSISDTIPDNAIILGAVVNSPTAVTSGGSATISVGTAAGSSATSILAATAKTAFSADAVQVFLAGTGFSNAAPFKMTAAGQINLTVAVAALTAGIVEISVFGIVATN